MYQVTREIDFCYGHRLLDYDGKCKHLHGHNGKALITLNAASLDKLGMVIDFADIKRVIQKWIDDKLDHRMILRRDDPVVETLREMGEPLVLIDDNPTAENIAKMIAQYGLDHGFPVVEVRLWETPHCSATYQVPDSGA
jgi:6-pyruvoyltetrahydropterin/6-carboxytetrahydropterin synthase